MKKHPSPQTGPPAALQLLPLDVFAARVGWHVESVRRACRQGRLAAVKLGRGWRLPSHVVEQVMQNGIPGKL